VRVNLEARAAGGEKRRAQTRRRLIEAAKTVLADRGAEALTIEDFVKAAGVARGTFYNYFPTVEELVKALNAELADTFRAEITSVAAGIDDQAKFMCLIFCRAVSLAQTDSLRAWLAVRVQGSGAPLMTGASKEFDTIFRRGVRAGRFHPIDPAAARNLYFGAMRLARSEILSGGAEPEHIAPLAAMILVAFGLDRTEADRISLECRDLLLTKLRPSGSTGDAQAKNA
jgi:TetR/AcrR family transcriptional regulator, ethionamide resistance regulator